jgi:hypothetical protein
MERTMNSSQAPFTRLFASRKAEAVMEAGMMVAAAAVTAAIWLGVGAYAVTPAAAAADTVSANIKLPTVTVVGRRDSVEPAVTTTAEGTDTAAIPVTLKQ